LLVRQPLQQCDGKGSIEELVSLAPPGLCDRLHSQLEALVTEWGGTYLRADRKSLQDRSLQKIERDYKGDFSKLLDLERATGLFEEAEGMLRCLQKVSSSSSSSSFSSSFSSFSSSSSSSLQLLRCKDRLNSPQESGYRDILLNVGDKQSGFVMELQLNFVKIAELKPHEHRFFELVRVMQLPWAE